MKIPVWTLAVVPTVAWYVGFLMNAIAVASNHGAMPVQFPIGIDMSVAQLRVAGDLVHSVMTSETHFKFLCDWILINGPSPSIASPGDVLEWFGEATQNYGFAAFVALCLNKLGLFKD